MTANGTLELSREVLQDWLRLPDTIGIVGVEFDGRTLTLKLHDVTHPDSASAVYQPIYYRREGSSDYVLQELRRI